MKSFMESDFLLNTETAIDLFESKVKHLPIFDFHCHLDPKEIWENKTYTSITQLWLGGDHYKWRAMRMNGIGERCITGEAEDWEKFQAWAETVPHLVGNPMYHWTHLELRRFFGIEKVLGPATAREIWEECNEKLKQAQFTPKAFIEKANVKFIGTTDDPLSQLEYHKLLNEDPSFNSVIAPTFRPDKALNIDDPAFVSWIDRLRSITGYKIEHVEDLVVALKQRIDYFHELGGRASDHDIQKLHFMEVPQEAAEQVFTKRLCSDQPLNEEEISTYRSYLLKELGKLYAEKKWVMQLHMGAMRNNNTKMKTLLGADAGFDSIGEANFAEGLSRYLDALDRENGLPRTVLFNLNPKDNAVLAGMMGNYYEEGVPGKIQFGSGWWFNDHIDGMEKQMKDLANVGLLSRFIGMLTDSRSFLSYARHEYFRRILCNLIGEWVEQGRIPYDLDHIGRLAQNISYYNARQFFLQR
ncbi:glucuronate isomerase [Paenibacillus terrae]|uniref:Uronate isomerase n=1 Tax=Paenibacillus terrae (strain HPL-003) TaxID=985665 RepID=G7VW42_PAETH|nr:glucuronate isomerase [Paenibacillus terrae]AET58843.1 glucuronate isomerase [Paenibacillus terrae HPL-003]